MHVQGGHYVIMKEGGKFYPISSSGGGGKRQRDESTTSPIATMADLQRLPDEILRKIVTYLDDESCEMLGQTCKRMDDITRSLRQAKKALGNIGNDTIKSVTRLQSPVQRMDGDERAIMIDRINTIIQDLTQSLRPRSMKQARFTDPHYHAVNIAIKRAKLKYVIWVVDESNRDQLRPDLENYLANVVYHLKKYTEWNTQRYETNVENKSGAIWNHVNKCMIMLNYMYTELGVQPPDIKGYEQLLQDFGKQTDLASDEPE